VTLAVLTRTWGRRGELAAISTSGGPERFETAGPVYLFREGGGEPSPAEIESVWQHRGQLIFKFRGIDSINDAEPLERHELRVPRERRAVLPEGEFYHSDLVGCKLIDRATGEPVGEVAGVQELGGPALLEVPREGADPMLVPFARAICVEVDVRGRRIVVDLPEGLKEL
jgi:16S rRNA processing protein RimM